MLPVLNGLFLATVVLYLLLLFIQPVLALSSIAIPAFHDLMLWISVTLVLIGSAFLYLALPRSITLTNGKISASDESTATFHGEVR